MRRGLKVVNHRPPEPFEEKTCAAEGDEKATKVLPRRFYMRGFTSAGAKDQGLLSMNLKKPTVRLNLDRIEIHFTQLIYFN